MSEDAVFARCPSCDWFGDRMDCQHGECPNCGRYVIKDDQDPLIRRDEVGI